MVHLWLIYVPKILIFHGFLYVLPEGRNEHAKYDLPR